MSETPNRVYEDEEVDQYYKQMNQPMPQMTLPRIIGGVILIILIIVFLWLNIDHLLRNR